MQLGPETPSSPPQNDQQVDQQTGHQADQQVSTDTDQPAQDAESIQSEYETQSQSEGNESFFETWTNGWSNQTGTPTGASMLFMAGVVIAFVVVMRSLIRSSAKRKRQHKSMEHPSERIDTINRRAEGSIEPARRAMVEAEELTRRMGAVLDNKATKIEILLQEANERIATLERANRDLSHQTPTEPPKAENPTPRSVCPEALDRARLDQDRVERLEQESADQTPPYKFERESPNVPAESTHPSKPMTFPEQVDELAVQGLDAMQIANKLNRPVGEVELVLNLRRNSG